MVEISFSLNYFQIYIIMISFISFCYYAYDKIQAIQNLKHIQRVPEVRLLFTTLIGGTIGSLVSMVLFRHKIKKPSFMIKFFIIFIIQLIIIFLYFQGYITLWQI